MPWKECHVMHQRTRFAARRLERQSMTAPCEKFGHGDRNLETP